MYDVMRNAINGKNVGREGGGDWMVHRPIKTGTPYSLCAQRRLQFISASALKNGCTAMKAAGNCNLKSPSNACDVQIRLPACPSGVIEPAAYSCLLVSSYHSFIVHDDSLPNDTGRWQLFLPVVSLMTDPGVGAGQKRKEKPIPRPLYRSLIPFAAGYANNASLFFFVINITRCQ
ncbi:hypothetical protein GW17_00060328 [Ensete ventricosum]|nr:hypothetical protein GW17_00060328 [Ensete ventricosum]RZS08407.1 hypothetical protein BHM03_00039379 [Ensete ventricosum]